MEKIKLKHPIRRVRDLLKNTPEHLRLRRHATATGFARLIGKSASHLRNVECGSVQNWDNLAHQIERRTKVSSKWLLSNPKPEDPVMDVYGEQWKPERYLDRLAPREGMPDWRYLLEHDPAIIPRLMAHLVESQIVLEISLGHDDFVASMIELFSRNRTFQNPAMKRVLSNFGNLNRESSIDRAMAAARTLAPQKEKDIERILRNKLESARIEDLINIVAIEGCGWVPKIGDLPKNGLLADAVIFFAKMYPEKNPNITGVEVED